MSGRRRASALRRPSFAAVTHVGQRACHPCLVDIRVVLVCTLLAALVAGAFALTQGRDYRARSFVIRVPPDFAGERGLERARQIDWLGEGSPAERTPRKGPSLPGGT